MRITTSRRGYLIVEPGDTTRRTRNLQQTNVNGYKWQSAAPTDLEAATKMVNAHPGKDAPPHSPEAQALCQQLMASFTYRLDTNFAKVDRIDNFHIEAFKSKVLSMRMRGRTMRGWATLLKQLNQTGETYDRAASVIQAIYDDL